MVLDFQALAKVPCRDTGRVKGVEHFQDTLDILHAPSGLVGKLLHGNSQVPIIIEGLNNRLSDFTVRFGFDLHIELAFQLFP